MHESTCLFNEYSQELHYFPSAIKLDRCVGNCNLLNDLYDPNKTEDLIKHVLI